MAYEIARSLLNSHLEKSQVITLYREMANRDISPDQWDRQLKFWSEMIKRWGRDACVIDFSVEELTKAWMYDSLYPPLQGALNMLVKLKLLRTREECLRAPSFFSRVMSFVWSREPAPSAFYVFQDNLREQAQQVYEQISSSAALITDVCITKEAIQREYPTVDIDLLCAELARMKQVEVFENGYFLHVPSFEKATRDTVNSVLTTKLSISRIEKELRQCEEVIAREQVKAATLKRQGRNAQAKNILSHRKQTEQRLQKLESMKSILETQLENIGHGSLTKLTIQYMKGLSKALKGPSVEEVEKLICEMEGTHEAVAEVSNAMKTPEIDDPEIEAELERMMGATPEKVVTFKTPQPEEEPKKYRRLVPTT